MINGSISFGNENLISVDKNFSAFGYSPRSFISRKFASGSHDASVLGNSIRTDVFGRIVRIVINANSSKPVKS